MVSQPRQPETPAFAQPGTAQRDGADHAQNQVHQGRHNDHDAEYLNRTMFMHGDRLLVDRMGMDDFAGCAGVLCMDDSLAQLREFCTRQIE